MGWSWVRVPRGSSPKLRDCIDGDPSASRFEECVRTIVDEEGGRVDELRFEPNAKWAQVGFWWDNPRVKNAVIYHLEGRQVLDLLSADEMDGIRTGDPPTAI